MSLLPQPTHTEITSFLQRLLPTSSNAREVPFHWHTPRHAAYNPSIRPTIAVVLSITPTPGFYSAINDRSRPSAPLSFLHRPWSLDRRAIRQGSLVLSCHASFDEHLTVGWNTELARRIGVDLTSAICIQGYKGNPDRKIGLVARLEMPRSKQTLADSLIREFDGAGELYLPETLVPQLNVGAEVRTIAIMNAFHEDEILRVIDATRKEGWIDPDEDGSSILYLTGAARDYGLTAAKEVNMSAFCVGHRACEEWGIRYLASQVRAEWPALEVIEVLEEEPVLVKVDKRPKARPTDQEFTS